MKILITGGAGFLGGHCTQALLRDGHELRLIVRDLDRARAALAQLHVPTTHLELVHGDICDRRAVQDALRGCRGVLNAAALFTFDRRRDDDTKRSSSGAHNVLTLAADAGCDRIVHVSSVLTLYPASGRIDASAPRGAGLPHAYVASKVAAEAIATELQQRGAPVVTTYPGSIWGAHDPGAGEMVRLLQNILSNRFCFRFPARAALPIADVEWLARAHAALFRADDVNAPRASRVTMSGHYTPWRDMFAVLRQVTGKRLPLLLPTPAPVALTLGRVFDALQRVAPFRMPFAHQNVWALFASAPTDDVHAHALAGPPPPLERTAATAVAWAMERGHIEAASLTSTARARLAARA
jgi:dihydroflavonol-4-reductase